MSPTTQAPDARASALEALVDAAAGILAADSREGTLGRISHHLRSLLHYDDLTVYEIDDSLQFLRPVFAVGNWVDEILSNPIPLGTGITGWAVRNRQTRSVHNSDEEPLCNVVAGTDDDDAEAFVCVPLLAEVRVVGALNCYRTADRPFTDDEATMAALAYDSARQRETLREQVKRDALTGLLNHRACPEWLRDALAAALPAGNPVGVVTLDIDHLKLINDAHGHGHAEGDRILASVAERLRSVVRASDDDRTGRSRVPEDDRQRDAANSYEHEPRHRITVPAEPGDRATFAAIVRHELEHARQFEEGANIIRPGKQQSVRSALALWG